MTTTRTARLGALAALALLAAAPSASAQERPTLEAARDYAATYRMLGAGDDAMRIGMQWRAADRVMRVDMPAGGPMGESYLLHDRRNNRMRMVIASQRMVMELPAEAMAAQGLPTEPGPNARFTRTGSDSVAGVPCTVWRYEEAGNTGTSCISAEGVVLRARAGTDDTGSGLEATAVTLAAQDAARFQVPAGFQSMQMPTGIPGAPPTPRR